MRANLTALRAKELISYDPNDGSFRWRVDRFAGSIGQRLAAKAGAAAGYVTDGYHILHVDGARCYAHRIAWLITYGEWPKGHIDHINGNPSDNRIANLRNVSRSQNMQNSRMKKNNKCGLKGVCWIEDRKTWISTIMVNRKRMHLGCYKTKEAAHSAYALAAYMFHGEYARAA